MPFGLSGAVKGLRIIDACIEYDTEVVGLLIAEGAPPAGGRDRLERMLVAARSLRGWLIEYLHKEARPGRTPDLTTVARGVKDIKRTTV